MNKLTASLCASAMLLAFSSTTFAAETITGVVTRLTVTLKMKNGKTKMFEVKGDVDLNNVDEGDEVEVVVEKGEITAIKVIKEDIDPPRKQ
jgi:hypothetical protein